MGVVRRAGVAVAIVLCLGGIAVSAMSLLPRSQQAANQTFPIESVTVAGVQRLTIEQVVKLSGLRVGDSIRPGDLESIARRVADTGLFDNVSYRYAGVGQALAITFEVEEAAWTMPVVFDNFVWWSNEELTAAVGEAIPTFDGLLPATDGARLRLVQTLQGLLVARGLTGTVDVLSRQHMKTGATQYVAKVTSPSTRLCSVEVAGGSAALAPELKAILDPLAGEEYSQSYLQALSGGTLLDIYRREGYWDAAFATPQVVLDAGCQGARVTLAVAEGVSYQFGGAEWTGNASVQADQLDSQLDLRVGAVANGAKLDASVSAIVKAYGAVGHLQAKVSYAPQLDPETRRARFAIHVSEGPQFRMGGLVVLGLAEKDAESVRKRWPIKTGEVFSTVETDKFWKDVMLPMLRRLRGRSAGPKLVAGAAPQTVDVTIEVQR